MDLEHEKRLTETESRSKSNTKRIEEVERKQNDLAELVSTVKILADREKRVEDDVSEIKDTVTELKLKPGKRWDGLVDKVILTIAAGIVGFIMAKFGLGG